MASTTPADSVLELKRGLKDQQQNNSSPLTTSTSGKTCFAQVFFRSGIDQIQFRGNGT